LVMSDAQMMAQLSKSRIRMARLLQNRTIIISGQGSRTTGKRVKHIAKEVISHEKAGERFAKKLLPENYGHEITVKWTGEKNSWGRAANDVDRDKFRLLCSVCLTDSGTPADVSYTFRAFTNKDGSIPQNQLTQANAHIRHFRPPEIIDENATRSHETWWEP